MSEVSNTPKVRRFRHSQWGVSFVWGNGHRAAYCDTPWFFLDFGLRPNGDWFMEGAFGRLSV